MNIIKKTLFTTLFTLSSFLLSSQTENQDKKQIQFNVVEGKTIIAEDGSIDSLGYDQEDEGQSFEEIAYRGPSIQFLYFEWMPGHGLYQNFDVTSIHYRHEGAILPDTLIFENYVHPAPYRVTSNYGQRRKRMHYGVDLGYPVGTPVVAVFSGIVRISQTNAGGYGNLIVLRHDNGLETYYGHLSKRLVNPGQVVQAGDTIGLGGSTGRSSGSHLHFETRYLGKPFNPTKVIDFTAFTLGCDTLYINASPVDAQILASSQPQISSKTTTTNTSNTTPSTASLYYKVKNGDTLSHIAARYGTSVSKIKKLNGLRSDFLRIGQRLRVK